MSTANRSHARVRLLIAVAGLLVAMPLAAAGPVAAGSTALMPDLWMSPLDNMQVQSTPGGRKKLRFDSIAYNVGDGPLEVRAKHRGGRAMQTIVQRIYRTDGTSRRVVLPDAHVFYSGDGHDHFHFRRFIVIRLIPHDPSSPTAERRLRKIGFCLVDSQPLKSGPVEPAPIEYNSCGTIASSSLRMGLSVGWGDFYPAFFAHQAIDVTGLPAGDYRLCARVNGNHVLHEKANNHANNVWWMDVTLDAANNDVTEGATGTTDC